MALAKELPVNMGLKAELYDTGLAHEKIMTLKNVRNKPCIKSWIPCANEEAESMGRAGAARCL